MDKGGTSQQVLRQPNGGGAVASIGSDFRTNLNTGTGTYAVPIELPEGHRRVRPDLSLHYNSGAGQGAFGLGWDLPVLAIQRDTRNGYPRYDNTDGLLLNGEDLVLIGDGLFRPRVDTTFQRVRRLEPGWEVTDRQGSRFLLGTSPDSQERHPNRAGEDGILTWLLDQVIDTTGNAIHYRYLADGDRLYLHQIDYAIFRLEVEYDEDRPDVLAVRRGGFRQTTRWRGRRIAIHNPSLNPSLLRSYDLVYDETPLAAHSLMTSVTLTGYLVEDDGGAPVTVEESAPPLRFSYSAFDPERRRLESFRSRGPSPPSLNTDTVDLVDLEGFGLPGVLEASGATQRYWVNRGDATWDVGRSLDGFPRGASLADHRVRFGDMNGDGRTDLLVSDGALTGFYPGEAVTDRGPRWGRLQPYGSSRPTFDARDRSVRLLDVNADGRVDAMRAGRDGLLLYEGRGADGWAAHPRPLPRRRDDPTYPDVTFADPRVRLADMTGDGLVDMVRVFARHIEYWPAIGSGRWDERQLLFLGDGGPDRFNPTQFHLADVNGDGLTDLIYVDHDAIYLWINRYGQTMSDPVRLRYPPPPAAATVRTADMLGTGTTGLVFGLSYRPGQREPYRYLDFTGGSKPYLLTTIDNGVGGVTEITYSNSTAHRIRDRDAGADWPTFLPRAVQLVETVVNRDLVTDQAATTVYSYHDGHFDGRTQRFAGFGRVDALENYGLGQAPKLVRSSFHLGLADDAPNVEPRFAPALRGLLHHRETLGPDESPEADMPYLVESTSWAVRVVETAADGSDILFPHPEQRRVERWERSPVPSVIVTDLEHDDFGNLLRERRRGISPDPVAAELAVDVISEYINDEARWLLGLPRRRTLRDGSGERLEDVRLYYDGLPAGQSTAGLLTRRERLAFTDAGLQDAFAGIALPDLETLGYRVEVGDGGQDEFWFDDYRVAHNGRGDAIEHRDPQGLVTTIDYDDVHGLYPVRTTNPAEHVAQATYHERLGSIETLTDANGQVTSYIYSSLGRVMSEVRPGDTAALPTVEYEYLTDGPPIATIMQRRRVNGQPDERVSISYYDGHGNTVQTRAKLDDGNHQVTGWQLRDARGLVVESNPNFVSPSPDFDAEEGLDPARRHRFRYDPLDRAVEVMNPAGQRSHAVHNVASMTLFDAQDNDPASPFADTPRVQRVDAFGRLVAVDEDIGGGTLTTSYHYDGADRLRRVVDASGSELLQKTFDLAGRKLEVRHRDGGRRRFLHDARDKLVLYVDARGRRVTWSHDELGRQRAVAYDGVEIERFTYDAGVGDHLVGRLAQAEDRLGRQVFSYDERGLVDESRRFIDGVAGSFDHAFGYDPDDRMNRVAYPDGAEVTYAYDAMGRLKSVTGLIADVVYDDQGRRETVAYTSGLRATYEYEVVSGRLHEHALTDPATGTDLFRQNFAYDTAGNVIHVADGRPPGPDLVPAPRSYEYDALGRLTRAFGGSADAPYDHDLDYDSIGNLTLHEPWRPEALLHDGARLTGFEDGGVPQVLFQYDANGCLASRPGMTLEFDPRDLLMEAVRDDGVRIEFGYDYAARRLRKRVVDAGGAVEDTLTIGEDFEVRPDGATVRRLRDPDGSATLVAVAGQGDRTLHHDHLGNTIIVRDEVTGNAREIHYLPYGQQVHADTGESDLLFAGKRLDRETGLYYFRMRYYDPMAGRFISPDPIALVNAERGRLRPLSLNPYVYALDNPLRYTDTSGLWTFWEGFVTVLAVVAVVAITAVTFGAGGVLALGIGAAVGAIIGGATTGSLEGALTGAMLGFGVVATAMFGSLLFGPLIGGALAGIQALSFIPGVRQNETYKDILGYSSWINPWTWVGSLWGATLFIINAVVYAGAYVFTWGDPPDWADLSVSFEQGMIVMEGGWIRPGRAWNNGVFTQLNPDDPGVADPTTRGLILSHERGHMLNNATFGPVATLAGLSSPSQEDSFWETMAESNVNPNNPVSATGKDERRRAGGRGFGDIPWWNP